MMKNIFSNAYKPLVLVIDPDRNYQSVMLDLLSEQMNLKFANNFLEALDLFSNNEFSMVISEAEFSDFKITDIIRKVKTMNPNIFFVVITSKNDTHLAVEVMQNGAVDFIVKPFSVEDIANLVDKYLKFSVNKKFDYDLINILSEEKRTFVLPTNIHLVGPFIYELMEMLKRFRNLSKNDIFSIRLAAYEMLINAMEHGNLEIDYDKKKKLLASGINYLEFLDKLSQTSPYKERNVKVSYHITENQIRITIRDEGSGFNVTSFNNRNIRDDLLALHGRGIIISRFNMDELIYNQTGNEVTLVKTSLSSST